MNGLKRILGDPAILRDLGTFCEEQASYFADTLSELSRPKTQDGIVDYLNQTAELVGQRKAWKSVMAELERRVENAE